MESKKLSKQKKPEFKTPLSLRGRQFEVIVVSTKMSKTAVVESEYRGFIKKYARYKKKTRRLNVHNPPNINANAGDLVRIMECRPLSKTKNFVIIENYGPQKGFKERMEALQESKARPKEVAQEKQDDKEDEVNKNATN